MSVSARGVYVSSGEGRLAGLGIPMPIHIGPLNININAIKKVRYVGFGGPLFSLQVGNEDYIFEARSQGDRNIWVASIQQWMRYPTGRIPAKKVPPPPPRPPAPVETESVTVGGEESWQVEGQFIEEEESAASWHSVDITATEPELPEQFVELDFDTAFAPT